MSRAALLAAMGAGAGIDFQVASLLLTTGSTPAIDISGVPVGSLMLLYLTTFSTETPTAPAGWTKFTAPPWVGGGYKNSFWKRIKASSAETSVSLSPHSGSGWPVMLYACANAADVTFRTSTESATGDSTLNVAGFSLAANSLGVLVLVLDRDITGTFSPPSNPGLASRAVLTGGAGFFQGVVYDFVAPEDYPEAVLTFTGFMTGNTQLGFLLEFTA